MNTYISLIEYNCIKYFEPNIIYAGTSLVKAKNAFISANYDRLEDEDVIDGSIYIQVWKDGNHIEDISVDQDGNICDHMKQFKGKIPEDQIIR